MEKRRHRLRESVFLKVVAAAAAIVTFFVGFFSAILAIACIQNDVYFDGGETFLKNATEIVNLEATQKFVSYLSNSSPRMLDGKVVDNEGYDENFDGYFFELCDVDTGDVIWSNLPDDYEESCTLVVDDSRWAMRVLTDYYIRDTDTQGDVFNALSNLVSKNEVLGFQGDLKAVYSFTFNDVGADYDNSLAESSDSPSLKPPVWIASEDTPYVTTFVGGEHVGPFEVTLLSISKDGDVTITPEGGRFFNRLIYLDSLDGITLTTDSSGEEYLISLSELKKIKDLFISFGTTDEIMALSGVSDSGMIEGGELTCTLDGYSRAASTIDFSAKTYIRNEGAPSYGDGHIANYPSSISFVVKKISQFAYYYPVIAVCCVIVWLLSTIYLCCAGGWRETSNGAPSPIWFDKLPYLIFAVLLIVGIVFSIQSYFELRYHLTVVFVNYRIATLAVWALVPLLTGILLTLTLMTTSVRLKCGVFWKYTATGYIFRITAKIWHAIKKAVKGFFAAVSVNWLIMVCGIAYLLYNVFWLLIFDDFLTPAMILLGNIAMIIILMIWAGGFTKLKNFIHKLAQGD